MPYQRWVPVKHNFHLLPTTSRNLGWVGAEIWRGEPSSIRSQSPSKQGSTFANWVTACVTAAVTWLTPVWAREWMKGESSFSAWKALRHWLFPLLLHVPCMPLFPPSSVRLIVLKSAFFKYTFRTSSPQWHEEVPFRTETKLNQIWAWKWLGFYPYLPQKNQMWKDTACKTFKILAVRVWELGAHGNGIISSGTSDISLPSLHSP